MWNRTRQIGYLAALVVVAVILAWSSAEIILPRGYDDHSQRYNKRSQRINEKICSLCSRRPANVRKKLWEDCVSWASVAHCNVCFSEGHTKYEAMLRYE